MQKKLLDRFSEEILRGWEYDIIKNNDKRSGSKVKR